MQSFRDETPDSEAFNRTYILRYAIHRNFNQSFFVFWHVYEVNNKRQFKNLKIVIIINTYIY